MNTPHEILLRPAVSYAVLKIFPFLLCSLLFLLLAWTLSPYFVFFSLSILAASCYRLLFIRSFRYCITPEIIRISKGIFFKRTDQLEMYRIKDYIITQPLSLRIFGLMNLILKGTDPENPVLNLNGIPQSNIVNTIRDHVQEARHNNHIYEIN